MMRRKPWAAQPAALAAPLLALLAGCTSSPLAHQTETNLRKSVVEAVEREVSDAEATPQPVTTSRTDFSTRLGIKSEMMPELERMAGPNSYDPAKFDLGLDLLNKPVRTTKINLQSAVRSAVSNNIAVQFARLGPAINEAQVQSAEAAFDWTIFSSLSYARTDSPVSNTFQTGSTSSVNSNDQYNFSQQAGVRRTLVGGGRLTAQLDESLIQNNTPGLTVRPNPAQTVAFTLQWDQPLLRNAGSEVTQAQIRIARNAERTSVQQLRRDMIRIVTDTERAYWDLVRAQRDVFILKRLQERGEKVRDQLEQRAKIDANQAQIADARARVERRRADVERAQVQLSITSDRLKQLMNHPDLPEGSEVLVLPADFPADEPVRFSLLESIRQAVAYRPEIQQSVIAIDDASIRRTIAANGRLPDLSLRLQARWSALDNTPGEAYNRLLEGRFLDYLFQLSFEQPIGNRAAESEFRRRQLERSQSVLAYRNSVQQATQEVKSALRRIRQNYDLIAQTRAARIAASESLRVLLVEK
ncbi:MAG: TolC family protein, partial [Phycisphaerales bacterium]